MQGRQRGRAGSQNGHFQERWRALTANPLLGRPRHAVGKGSEKFMPLSPFLFASLFTLILGNAKRPSGKGSENERRGKRDSNRAPSGVFTEAGCKMDGSGAAQGFPAPFCALTRFSKPRQKRRRQCRGVWAPRSASSPSKTDGKVCRRRPRALPARSGEGRNPPLLRSVPRFGAAAASCRWAPRENLSF